MSQPQDGNGSRMSQLKARLTTVKAWELPKQKSAFAPPGVWTNIDMDPTPPAMRNWGMWTYIAYWFSDLINAVVWVKASSVVSLGLDWRNAIGIFTLAAFLLGLVMVFNGAMGAFLLVPFPVAIRSSFGYYFSRFAVVSRVILAFFWFAINSWSGGTAVTGMISAIWPSYKHLPNHVSASAGFTTQSMLSYFIFWVIQFPFLLIHPTKLRWLFITKAIVAPTVAIATMAWAINKAGGTGVLVHQRPTVHGEAYAHAWLFSLNSVIGGYATVGVNIPDFTRYSKRPISQWIQLPLLPFFYIITSLFGILTASCTKQVYGTALWSPFDVINKWDNRAAAFFACAAWCVAQIGSNVTANSISGANDLTTLFPRWINLKRGSVICALIGGWCMVPWKILKTGQSFLTFISGYTVFLGPMAGLMIADFWIVRRRKIDVPALYDPHGRYRYWWGINWRTVVTLVLVVPPTIPGLIVSINKKIHVGGINWIFLVSWIWGVLLSMTIYTLLNYLFPATESLIDHAILAEYDDSSKPSSSANQSTDDVSEKEKMGTIESQ